MVKKKKILLFIFITIVPFIYLKSQPIDSINCDYYFNWLNENELINLWSRAPQLKETNAPILSKLCKIAEDNYQHIAITLILNEEGKTICIKIYPEIIEDTIRNEMIKLLNDIEFIPALKVDKPVISHYLLILNKQKCEVCKNKKKKKNKNEFYGVFSY